ncbi:MAG TPA: cupin domain-containing protein [Steroidobacteraceae bacterium]|nr:cupin domain-containing protein [Steroidobacteraceae bacterium]
MLKKRDFIVAGLAVSTTLACISIADEAKQVLDSTAWKWEDILAKDTDVGQYRYVTRQPTRTLDELEMHITTLKPHTASHAPHTHPNEEMVIVKEGTLQAHVNGKEIVVGPGSVLFFASLQPHAVQNIGDTPATYHVINWKTAATPAVIKQIPKTPAPSTAQ